MTSFSGQHLEIHLASPDHQQPLPINDQSPPRISVYSGEDITAIINALEQQKQSNQGPCRLAIISRNDKQLLQRTQQAKQLVIQKHHANADLQLAPGIYFRQTPLAGEVSFVFTGAASAYRTIGTQLLIAIPELADAVLLKFPCLAEMMQDFYQAETSQVISPFDQLKAASFLCQVHAELSQKILGLRPDATLGISSGETNALFALDVMARYVRDVY